MGVKAIETIDNKNRTKRLQKLDKWIFAVILLVYLIKQFGSSETKRVVEEQSNESNRRKKMNKIEWYSTADAAKMAGISKPKIAALASEGKLPGVDFGTAGRHLWRFRKEVIDGWIEAGCKLPWPSNE